MDSALLRPVGVLEFLIINDKETAYKNTDWNVTRKYNRMIESFTESLKSDPEMKAVNINTAFGYYSPYLLLHRRKNATQ